MKYTNIIMLILSTMLGAIVETEGRIISRCQLARELKSLGFSNLGNWVCLVESESSRNTAALHINSNGSRDYGLFQINDGYWCRRGRRGGDCNMDCNYLRNNDIRDDARCVKIIYRRHGFNAWYGWKAKCRGRNVSSYIRGCGV